MSASDGDGEESSSSGLTRLLENVGKKHEKKTMNNVFLVVLGGMLFFLVVLGGMLFFWLFWEECCFFGCFGRNG